MTENPPHTLDRMVDLEVRRKWPRVLRMVEEYVGNRHLAARYLAKAVRNRDELYVGIVRTAFERRHARKRRSARMGRALWPA